MEHRASGIGLPGRSVLHSREWKTANPGGDRPHGGSVRDCSKADNLDFTRSGYSSDIFGEARH